MKAYINSAILLASLVILFLAVGLLVYKSYSASVVYGSKVVEDLISEVIPDGVQKNDKEIIFTGDVMLARDVERRQITLAPKHSLSELQDLFRDNFVVGNFEASVPKVHEPTPSMVMKFSVAKENLDLLSKAGFTHFSLANNHTLDYGIEGYQNTVSELGQLGLVTGGYPVNLSSSSVSYIETDDGIVGIVFINATFAYPDKASWKKYIDWAESNCDLTIAYIHWGDEYELIHNEAQENLARALIDEGVDLIIGHHPHVIQDVGLYKDRLIFYSLGNLVFDQYWNNDVSEGLLLALRKDKRELNINLYGVESRTVKTQPRLMSVEESESLFQRLAERSDPSIREQILEGSLQLQF